jgi:hypothetical protein
MDSCDRPPIDPCELYEIVQYVHTLNVTSHHLPVAVTVERVILAKSTDPSMSLSPDTTAPSEDIGAETQRRFRHQAAYASLIACGLLDDASSILELFCEHHDDVLLLMKSGLFRAIQLKTRAVGRPPLKSGDDEILSALRRFATLDASFPERFERFVIASNVGFWKEKKNGSNVDYILNAARAGGTSKCSTLIRRVKENREVSDVDILSVLARVELATIFGIEDVDARLCSEFASLNELRDKRYDEVRKAALEVLHEIMDASGLAQANCVPTYVALCTDRAKEMTNRAVIESKRMTAEKVRGFIARSLTASSLLKSSRVVPLDQLPRGFKTMEKKLASGGMSVAEIEHLSDLKLSMEALLTQWSYRFGRDKAQEYYEHIRVLVTDECLAARQSADVEKGLHASEMLSSLRKQLESRLQNDANMLLSCSKEHLLGMAGILTEDCKVWWSIEFNLESPRS